MWKIFRFLVFCIYDIYGKISECFVLVGSREDMIFVVDVFKEESGEIRNYLDDKFRFEGMCCNIVVFM